MVTTVTMVTMQSLLMYFWVICHCKCTLCISTKVDISQQIVSTEAFKAFKLRTDVQLFLNSTINDKRAVFYLNYRFHDVISGA